MENKSCQVSESKLLQHLGNLRKKMIQNHELENLSEFVLHDLCTGPCFQVNKAAYFINNPDFNLVRGIAGYHHQEPHAQVRDVWTHQKQFIAGMQDSDFNKKVRVNNLHSAFEFGKSSEKYLVEKLADELEIANPLYHVWNLKHANHGLLIYESNVDDQKHVQDHVLDGFYYLSFCPVY
ncbi:hypothetical protein KBC04_02840 [Candidatus Babeliales bacterium]|nr:hypothetical protein [Candidatus Babeliales bacterium]MBP9844010.1 hypothetical protein [Candidatus Babeliales bacterium]